MTLGWGYYHLMMWCKVAAKLFVKGTNGKPKGGIKYNFTWGASPATFFSDFVVFKNIKRAFLSLLILGYLCLFAKVQRPLRVCNWTTLPEVWEHIYAAWVPAWTIRRSLRRGGGLFGGSSGNWGRRPWNWPSEMFKRSLCRVSGNTSRGERFPARSSRRCSGRQHF